MTSLNGWKKVPVVILLSAAAALASRAQTFKTLLIFDVTDGATPVDTPFVQGTDGNLYGTTLGGGSNGSGTVFKITAAGEITTLYSFCSQANCADGSLPYGGLVLGRNGYFYGTTSQGGANGTSGTVFRITRGGELTTLHSFEGSDGSGPMAPLIQATDGNFYGTTENGGVADNAGTIFKITPSGTLTTLYSFGSPNGEDPIGPLVQGSDGNFYGTTELGGTNFNGTVFTMKPDGTLTTLHSFDGTDGESPACGLVQASDGHFYGTTYSGGANFDGTVFKITSGGTLTTLHNFDGTDGGNPVAGLIQATDGNFYGTTYGGGTAGGWGTVYKITPSGTVTTLHSFDGNDGAQPYSPVAQATNGNVYGTATNGLSGAPDGTIFEILTGFSPFVSFVSSSGKAGQNVEILGQGFTGTTTVLFNGTSATFKVNSDAFLTATVPAGATSGFVKVVTPTGTLRSNVRFRIVP
jgi:uncharacterized repeat protein (TIGR03803 family)